MAPSARIISLGLLVMLAACTNPYDPSQRAAGGALIGAGTGATIGGLAGGGRGAVIGALAGGLGGAAIGAATTPTPPQYQPGYPPQGYGQTYAPPPHARLCPGTGRRAGLLPAGRTSPGPSPIRGHRRRCTSSLRRPISSLRAPIGSRSPISRRRTLTPPIDTERPPPRSQPGAAATAPPRHDGRRAPRPPHPSATPPPPVGPAPWRPRRLR